MWPPPASFLRLNTITSYRMQNQRMSWACRDPKACPVKPDQATWCPIQCGPGQVESSSCCSALIVQNFFPISNLNLYSSSSKPMQEVPLQLIIIYNLLSFLNIYYLLLYIYLNMYFYICIFLKLSHLSIVRFYSNSCCLLPILIFLHFLSLFLVVCIYFHTPSTQVNSISFFLSCILVLSSGCCLFCSVVQKNQTTRLCTF